MKSKLFGMIALRRSVRGQILWAVLLSLVLGTIAMTLTGSILNRFSFAHRIFLLPPIVFIVTFYYFFLLFTRKIVRYTRILGDGLMSIAEGRLHYRVPITREDELGHLAERINHMAEQIQHIMERERRIEHSKIELITGLSHDLRTPLTSIIGYLNLIKNEAYQNADEQQRFVNNACLKSQQLKKLVDDLFEYTRLINRDIGLNLQEVELKLLLQQMISEFEPIAEEQELSVVKSWDSERMLVHVDTEQLVRAIDNLLMNALKFSVRPGEIKVRMFTRGKRACLAIENRGEPISKEVEQRLFERFYKGEASRKDKHSPAGSGLGLSIAKNIVELHGGRVWFEHHDGHFTFYIELPLVNHKENRTNVSSE